MSIRAERAKPSVLDDALRRLRDMSADPSDRAILSIFFAALFLLAYAPNLIVAAVAGRFPTAEVLAFAAIAVVLKSSDDSRLLRGVDLAALALASILLVHPWRHIGSLALTVVGVPFLAHGDKRLASLGQLSLALAWIGGWGKIVLHLISPWLLPVETALGYFALSPFGSFSLAGNAIISSAGHGVMVYPLCSAFNNTIAASVIWLSLIKIQEDEFRPWHGRFLGLALAGLVVVNSARLALMAYSREQYLFWHGGDGATIISAAMTFLVIGSFLAGRRREAA